MEKYDYLEAVKDDVHNWIKDNLELSEWDYDDELTQHLEDRLWCCDPVTGNSSGSYTFNAYEAEEYIAHNWDLIGEAIDEGYLTLDSIRRGPEHIDVALRCYVFQTAIEEALRELREDENSDYSPICRCNGEQIFERYNGDLRLEFTLDQINQCQGGWSMVLIFIAELLDTLDCSFIGEEYSVGNFSMARSIYNAYSGTYYTLIYSDIFETLLKNKPLTLIAREGSDDDLIDLISDSGYALWDVNNGEYRVSVVISNEYICYTAGKLSEETLSGELPRNGMNIIEARNLILEQSGYDLQRIVLKLIQFTYD